MGPYHTFVGNSNHRGHVLLVSYLGHLGGTFSDKATPGSAQMSSDLSSGQRLVVPPMYWQCKAHGLR